MVNGSIHFHPCSNFNGSLFMFYFVLWLKDKFTFFVNKSVLKQCFHAHMHIERVLFTCVLRLCLLHFRYDTEDIRWFEWVALMPKTYRINSLSAISVKINSIYIKNYLSLLFISIIVESALRERMRSLDINKELGVNHSASSHWKEPLEVVLASDQEASWTLACIQLGGNPVGITCPSGLGMPHDPPRKNWRTWLWRRMAGLPCLACSHHNLHKLQKMSVDVWSPMFDVFLNCFIIYL